MRAQILSIGLLAGMLLANSTLSAGIVAHTSEAGFLAAAGGTPTVVNFDTTLVGTFIPNNTSLGGITFQYGGPGFGAAQLRVTDGTITNSRQLSTTSGTRFLGTDVGGAAGSGDQLAAGGANNFIMQFAEPVRAVGLFVIVSDDGTGGGAPVFPADFVLSAAGGSATSLLPVTPNLADGSQAFFLGLTEDTGAPLGAITLASSNFSSGFTYRVDNISFVTAVPEPSVALGALWLVALSGPFMRPSRASRH
jgi:hypothetical protein